MSHSSVSEKKGFVRTERSEGDSFVFMVLSFFHVYKENLFLPEWLVVLDPCTLKERGRWYLSVPPSNVWIWKSSFLIRKNGLEKMRGVTGENSRLSRKKIWERGWRVRSWVWVVSPETRSDPKRWDTIKTTVLEFEESETSGVSPFRTRPKYSTSLSFTELSNGVVVRNTG